MQLTMYIRLQVRVRVDYTGFSTINTQRFGQGFVGRVANPQDIILWAKPPAKRQKVRSELFQRLQGL